MAIRPGLAMSAAVVLGSCAVVSGLAGTSLSAGAIPASEPSVCVYQYSPSHGDAYFALGVRADRALLPLGEVRTHAVLVDTSASQCGVFRQRSMEVVRGYLASLGNSDRVRLYAVDVKAEPMMLELASPKSEACAAGLRPSPTAFRSVQPTSWLACGRSSVNCPPTNRPQSSISAMA